MRGKRVQELESLLERVQRAGDGGKIMDIPWAEIGEALKESRSMTRKQGHTPGPWYWQAVGGEDLLRGSNQYIIARCRTRHTPIYEGNARLVAAAPELLAALVAAEAWASYAAVVTNDPEARRSAGQARAAIAKATGRQ